MNIQALTVPSPIKDKLLELSRSINFERQSRKGSNGWLFFGVNRISGQRIALKFYDWGGDQIYHAEPRHLAAINSENVIQILSAEQVDDNFAYFLTPYYPNGDLDEELCRGNLGSIRAVNVTRDILSGLSHLHAISLLHGDLKPQNIILSDGMKALIGDFGSVKKLPEGHDTVPGSGHSLIYRPPESVSLGCYGVPGDIYQIGIILFQLLGGYLPYEESAWLNKRELTTYRSVADSVDRQIYANDRIKEKIRKGRIVNISTLPVWVCTPLKRAISKACNIDSTKRFQSCAEFLAHINSIRTRIKHWSYQDDCLTLEGPTTSYRICFDQASSGYYVLKKRTGTWRRDNSFPVNTLGALVIDVERAAPNR